MEWNLEYFPPLPSLPHSLARVLLFSSRVLIVRAQRRFDNSSPRYSIRVSLARAFDDRDMMGRQKCLQGVGCWSRRDGVSRNSSEASLHAT
ncbi:hypothetical protein E2C01_012361 [Portunus trituberculatus]|uniref:Uncharacterized protein n=1 Tax=Portunus trituberculatus TaxID=210409 RepID=A0A5B7DE04_PORTR|nr:hypothetical protein [Portunus trituberculatus]